MALLGGKKPIQPIVLREIQASINEQSSRDWHTEYDSIGNVVPDERPVSRGPSQVQVHGGLATVTVPAMSRGVPGQKTQQSSGLKTKDSTKDLVNTYKRRRSAMVRKENRSPNVISDLAEFKSNIASTKEPEEEDLSHVTPFSCIDLKKLIIPKGKRKSRGSIKLKHLDSIGNVRSEADTEKEVKCPLAKKYKPTNHCAEPTWLKFSRKRRTSAARNKPANGMDSCKAEPSKRFSSDWNESRSCVGGGKDAIFDDSNTFIGSNSLTSVSSNSKIVPPVGSMNSAYCGSSHPKKMPKSSLIRELVQLEFSDIPLGLDYSCKNLRRRKHIANVRVLLSQHLDTDTIMQQKRVLARLGISIATSASDATHFVTNTFSRTKNMLEAIALGIPIVTELWLENCAQAGCLVDEKNYILKDARKEKEIGFSLSASLAKAARHPLLKGEIPFNAMVARFESEVDMRRVPEGGPWLYVDWAVLGEKERIQETKARLDIVVSNEDWISRFQGASVTNGMAIRSDHPPVIL
ncbi:hypothetical protein QQ045_026612 [Rhodiola kirilowii]